MRPFQSDEQDYLREVFIRILLRSKKRGLHASGLNGLDRYFILIKSVKKAKHSLTFTPRHGVLFWFSPTKPDENGHRPSKPKPFSFVTV